MSKHNVPSIRYINAIMRLEIDEVENKQLGGEIEGRMNLEREFQDRKTTKI